MTGRRAVAALLLLAGCAGAGDWAKPGIDDAAAASAYRECRAVAEGAVKTEADIDQDIIATRQRDWQRGGVARLHTSTMREHTRDRAVAIVDSCMQAKGFARAR